LQGVLSRPKIVYHAERTVAGLAAGSGLNDSNAAMWSIVFSTFRAGFGEIHIRLRRMRKYTECGRLFEQGFRKWEIQCPRNCVKLGQQGKLTSTKRPMPTFSNGFPLGGMKLRSQLL
jgi:hypothetical protein